MLNPYTHHPIRIQGPEQTLCGFGVLVRPGAGVVSVGFGLFGLSLGGRFAQFDSAIPPVIREAVLEGTRKFL